MITALLCMVLSEMLPLEQPPAQYAYLPIDLRPVMNTNPWDTEAMRVPELQIAETPHLILEGASAHAAEGAQPAEAAWAAQGTVLAGLAHEGNWAEWAFDVPFESDEAVLHIRVQRAHGEDESTDPSFRPFSVLSPTLNGRSGSVLYVHADDPGAAPAPVIAETTLGRIRMGRHVLRLTTRIGGAPIAVDTLWIGARKLDIPNRLDADDRARRPFSVHTLAYAPGRLQEGGIPFDLLDPEQEDAGRAVFLPGDEAAEIAVDGLIGDALVILGAGARGGAATALTVRYQDGTESAHHLEWPPLYGAATPASEERAVPLGLFRHAVVRSVPLEAVPIASVAIAREGIGRPVILALTLRHPAGAAEAP